MTPALLALLALGATCIERAVDEIPTRELNRLIDDDILVLETEGYYLNDVPGVPMRCSREFARRWRDATYCAYERARRCLLEMAPSKAQAIEQAVSGWAFRLPAIISCFRDPCFSGGATGFMPEAFRRLFNTHMVLNESMLENQSDDDLCETALHEMLHWAGLRGATDHNSGKDDVYSCARYCGGRCNYGAQAGMADCLGCAENQDRKQVCGLGVEYYSRPSASKCDQSTCTSMRWARFLTCDNKPIADSWLYPEGEGGLPQCCEAGCSLDTCAGFPSVGIYPCDQPAPECANRPKFPTDF